ncbi:hypothetical protein [Psychrobacter sanguinis]|uniref:MatB fimbrillin n=1 Tax=Psychrobacter sanguinis TaxID=861445 RepID=A0A844LWZ8_9GAMM|nr:hypothetical protein [Psychrobacter sanguinis]MUG31301.1 hypothetical protein [Psychrobacter sanguinis]
MKLFSKIALATATISIASVASAANSISGSTDFRVTLPEILVLYHWDDAHLTLTDVTTSPENDSDPREISDATTRDLSAGLSAANPYLITGDVNSNEPTGTTVLGDKISVTLKNSWAVRSLSSGDVTLALDNTGDRATLINQFNAASKITTENAKLKSTAGEGTTLTIPSGWTAVTGDINFDLNLALANNSGEYNTRGVAGQAGNTTEDNAKDTFLLTLTGHTPATGQ